MDASGNADAPVIDDLIGLTDAALPAVERYFSAARQAVGDLVIRDGRTSSKLVEQHQTAVHGLAWVATYAAGLRQMAEWGKRLDAEDRFGELERLMVQTAFGEYLNQLSGGIALSQVEMVRPGDLGVAEADHHALISDDAVAKFMAVGNTAAGRTRIAALIEDGHFGAPGLSDEMLDMVRDQFRRFAAEQVLPGAHEWHLKDELIPIEIVEQMAELGVFGLTVPEDFGGLGLGKMAMCVVTEELSRAYIGVGSLGTRSEIAAELIRLGGTDDQ